MIENRYKELSKTKNQNYASAIAIDVRRTFDIKNASFIGRLTRILHAYANHNPAVGYFYYYFFCFFCFFLFFIYFLFIFHLFFIYFSFIFHLFFIYFSFIFHLFFIYFSFIFHLFCFFQILPSHE